MNVQIEAVKAKTEKMNGKALMVLTTGGKASAYGLGSRFGIIHDVLVIKPVDANIGVSPHGQSISFEYLAGKNPDYLFCGGSRCSSGRKIVAKTND
jgi:iron complex transport system substrate-binding protein